MLTGDVVTQYEGSGFKWATDQAERNKLWTARHNAFYAVLAVKPNCRASFWLSVHHALVYCVKTTEYYQIFSPPDSPTNFLFSHHTSWWNSNASLTMAIKYMKSSPYRPISGYISVVIKTHKYRVAQNVGPLCLMAHILKCLDWFVWFWQTRVLLHTSVNFLFFSCARYDVLLFNYVFYMFTIHQGRHYWQQNNVIMTSLKPKLTGK